MAVKARIRLSEFVSIFGMFRETYRAMLYQGRLPFRTINGGDTQMTYGGAEALAMQVFLDLTANGARHDYAAQRIMASGAAPAFLDALDAGAPCEGWCFALPECDRTDEMAQVHSPMVLDALEISNLVAWEIGTADQPFVAGQPRLGLRSLAVVPLAPAYRKVQAKARAAGYLIDGRHILQLPERECVA